MILYSPVITNRLSYIAEFIGREITGQPIRITDSPGEFIASDLPRINYSTNPVLPDEFWIPPHSLLLETGIRDQDTECFDRNGFPAFFRSAGDFGFDIFAAAFYLLSRYEEYRAFHPDSYGRFGYMDSLAYREGFLKRPLVNEWIGELKKSLQAKFPGFKESPKKQFRFLPTYDIDEAYSYRHKQWWRSAGAATRDLLTGRFRRFQQRRRVLDNKEPDPFDSFTWIDDLHRPFHLDPRYFFLVAEHTGTHDRNILPEEPALQTLIRHHAGKYSIGVHPSWQSGDEPALLLKEKEWIEMITRIKVTSSRQHFIRMRIPETYRLLEEAGIREEFSMGYGSINGFRASVASPFSWYDLEKERISPLVIYPFCFMEANSFFEQRYKPEQALEELRHYRESVQNVNGLMITIWHNTFLGTDPMYAGWREVYARFVQETMS
ncbi:MAG: polysaccharide deacetylase family protein [Chitinophagaceae bacterium]